MSVSLARLRGAGLAAVLQQHRADVTRYVVDLVLKIEEFVLLMGGAAFLMIAVLPRDKSVSISARSLGKAHTMHAFV
jgi:hypothetical protein